MANTPYYTKAETDSKIKSNISPVVSGFKGTLLIADTPTDDGYYSPQESGTYTNAGNLEYLPNTTDQGFDVKFIKSGSTWIKNRVDLSLTFDETPTEGSPNPVESGGTFESIKAVQDDVNINKKDITDVLTPVSDIVDVFAQDVAFTNTSTENLTTLQSGITYTIVANSNDTLTNGLRFYVESSSLTLIKTFTNSEDYVAGVEFQYTPTQDVILFARTELVGVDVAIKVSNTVEKSEIIEDTKSLKNLLEVEDTNVEVFNDTVTTASTAVEDVDYTLTGGKTYIIEATSVDNLTSGLLFYRQSPTLEVIKTFLYTEDYVAGVSFEYTPEVDTIVRIRTYLTGSNVNVVITEKPFNSTKINELNKTLALKSEKEVLSIVNYTTEVTAIFKVTEFSRYAGKTIKLDYQAQYTGRFRLYAFNGTSLTVIKDILNTNFSTGVTFEALIPSDTLSISFRTDEIGNVIDFIKIYSDEFKYNSIPISANQWRNKTISFYGDSITAISNGTFSKPFHSYETFSEIIGKFLDLDTVIGRGVGSQKYDFDTNGGSVVFLNSDGSYNSRNNTFNYDNYVGNVTVPSGTTPVRGAFSSWLRIKTMYPASIKDNIDTVVIMGGTNDAVDATSLSWIPSDSTDPEWAASTEYLNYNGDYNINSLEGGVASTIMKFQAWMPNARVIIATPLSGRGTTGSLDLANPITQEYTKSKSIRTVSSIFSIPVIDVNSECGINGANRTTFITDGVHPYNEAGRKAVAMAMMQGLRKIFPFLLATDSV